MARFRAKYTGKPDILCLKPGVSGIEVSELGNGARANDMVRVRTTWWARERNGPRENPGKSGGARPIRAAADVNQQQLRRQFESARPSPADSCGRPGTRPPGHHRKRPRARLRAKRPRDRKSTRLNSSHVAISYA